MQSTSTVIVCADSSQVLIPFMLLLHACYFLCPMGGQHSRWCQLRSIAKECLKNFEAMCVGRALKLGDFMGKSKDKDCSLEYWCS